MDHKPKTSPRIFCLGVLAVGVACAHADRAEVAVEGNGSARAAVNDEPTTITPDVSQADTSLAGDDGDGDAALPPGPEHTMSMVGIFLHPDIAARCDIEQPDAYFAFDSTKVDAEDKGELWALGTCMKSGPLAKERLEIVGHTDPRGSDEYNQELGRSRAESVADYLEKRGVKPSRMTVASQGEKHASDEPSEWPEDRRVDILLAEKKKK